MATDAPGIESPRCHQSTCDGGSCQEQGEIIKRSCHKTASFFNYFGKIAKRKQNRNFC